MDLITKKKTWQVQLTELKFKGIDVFSDGTISIWEEVNPRDCYSDCCEVADFLNGKFQDWVEKELGAAVLKEIIDYLKANSAC